MFSIDNDSHQITLTRGDSALFTITARDGATGAAYTPAAGDSAVFTVKRYLGDAASPAIQKTTTLANNMEIELTPSDTRSLRVGDYHYDVQLVLSNQMVQTIIDDSLFRLTREVNV